jgi:hypothetical protein
MSDAYSASGCGDNQGWNIVRIATRLSPLASFSKKNPPAQEVMNGRSR